MSPPRGVIERPLRADPERQKKFLDVLAATGSLIEAARQSSPHSDAGCLSSYRLFMRDSAEFSARVQSALDSFRDSLIQAAIKRGRDGYKRPIFQRGELVGHEQVYSDNLLLAELRKHFPTDYSERHHHEHRIQIAPVGSWTIGAEDVAMIKASPEGDRLLASLREVMTVVRDGRRQMAALPAPVEDAEYQEVYEPDENGDFIPW